MTAVHSARLPRPAATSDEFLADALAGLRSPRKELPCKYFYDATGSRLFDQICETPEYYPTRTELAIMRAHAGEMGELVGPNAVVIEYGSGSSVKTRHLLRHIPRPTAYIPVDISAEHLHHAAAELSRRFPEVEVKPVAADFTKPFELPDLAMEATRRVVYFPGSTIGNFAPAAATVLLRGIARLCGRGGGLLIGVDRKKDPTILDAAYNDAGGVTAAFNLNLLTRMNRELGADFDLAGFRHRAIYNSFDGRVEMHLVSVRDQTVRLAGNVITFATGETIHTENSHKYSPDEFASLANRAGFRSVKGWTDTAGYFGVQFFTVG